MRSAVQSCVPLQESTANRCAFFVHWHQASPKGLGIDIYVAESLLLKRQKWQWTGRTRSGRRTGWSSTIKHHRDWHPAFLGTMRTDLRIRRSPPGDWNILRPATWKSSTYETFVSAFFILGNTEGTQTILFFTLCRKILDCIYPTDKNL